MNFVKLCKGEYKYITWVKDALSELLETKKYMIMNNRELVTERNFCMVLVALIYKNNYEEMERGLDGKPVFISGEVGKEIYDKKEFNQTLLSTKAITLQMALNSY